jgi:hypothetical protein
VPSVRLKHARLQRAHHLRVFHRIVRRPEMRRFRSTLEAAARDPAALPALQQLTSRLSREWM